MKTIVHVSITFIILFPIFCLNGWSNPFTIEHLLQTAKNDYFAGDIQQYSSIADTVLAELPENPTANILKGLALLESSKIQDRLTAKEIIEKYARRLDNDAFALYAMGILYKKRNIPVSSRKYFEEALEYDECLVPAMIELGDYYYHQMLNYYHRYTDTEVALSFRKYALEDYDYAVSYLRTALRCDPGNREAANLLGALYYETAEYTLMEHLFQEMLELYPEDMRLIQFLGLAYLSQNNTPVCM